MADCVEVKAKQVLFCFVLITSVIFVAIQIFYGKFVFAEYLWIIIPLGMMLLFNRKKIYIEEDNVYLIEDQFFISKKHEYKIKDISDIEDEFFGLSMFAKDSRIFFDYCLYGKSDLLKFKEYIEGYQNT